MRFENGMHLTQGVGTNALETRVAERVSPRKLLAYKEPQFQFSHLRGRSQRDRIVEHDELADAVILCEMRTNRADMSDSATSEDHKDS